MALKKGRRLKEEGGRTRALLCLFLLFVLLPSSFSLSPASAQSPPPTLTQPVNDFANVIDSESAREVDRRIRALLDATGDVVAVATVKTFKPHATIEEYATRMFENGGRGIGQKGKDNGALIVVAVDDRQVRIEVGYDLEEFVTDGFAGETIRQAIAPEFRNGQYGRGLLAGVTRIITRVADRRGATLEGVPRPQQPGRSTPFPWGILVPILWIILIMAFAGRRRRRRRGPWGGPWSGWNSGVGPFGGGTFGGGFGGFGGGGGGFGGGGGGFGGFSGGRSGGGGASGGW